MCVVWLKNSVVEAIMAETYRWSPKETGGVLIGYVVGKEEIVITGLVGPGPSAKHTVGSFSPDNEYQTREIGRHYMESGRINVYLGDWHSHPNAPSYLSPRDIMTFKKIALFKPARMRQPLMLVLGTDPVMLNIWRFTPGGILSPDSIKPCRLNYWS